MIYLLYTCKNNSQWPQAVKDKKHYTIIVKVVHMIRDDTIGFFLLVCGQVTANKPARCFSKRILLYLKETFAYIFGTTLGWVMNDWLFDVLISKTIQIQVPVLMAQLGLIWLGSSIMRLSRWSGHAEIVLLCELYLHLAPALPKWAQISLPVRDIPRDWKVSENAGKCVPTFFLQHSPKTRAL